MARKSELPFGAQFSPNQVDLSTLLKIVHVNRGDRTKITEAIRDGFFSAHSCDQQLKLADNTVLAMHAYGLLGDDYATPTALADELLALSDDTELYKRFAKHIMTNLRGIAFVETLQMMHTAGEEINLHAIARRLEQRGLHVPRGSVHLSSMRLWLACAGIFPLGADAGQRMYEIDQVRLRELLGIGLDAIDNLTHLGEAQRAFLRALVRIPEPDPFVANKIADLASLLYRVEYNHKDLPKSVVFPLRELGYVEATKSTVGHGAKPYLVSRTGKFRQEISEPILSAAANNAGPVPKQLFETPLSRILLDLKSPATQVKGRALELLAIYFARLLDLSFKGWRLRSADTGGAEVDVIVEGARLIFSRWQIQAKNTDSVRLDDVAKEVGLSLTFIYSNVVMLVTTGRFTNDAHRYADYVMKTSNLNIVLLSGQEIERISHDPTEVVPLLNTKAEQAMKVKERSDYFVA